MSKQYPRDLAVRVLTRVLSDREPLDEALASLSGQVQSPQARAWLQEICSGTLRWKGRLDLAIDSTALKKKTERLAAQSDVDCGLPADRPRARAAGVGRE